MKQTVPHVVKPMGDMADVLYAQTFAYDDGTDDMPEEGHSPRTVLTCFRCGAKGLRWAPTKNDKWWYKEHDGKWHNCMLTGERDD